VKAGAGSPGHGEYRIGTRDARAVAFGGGCLCAFLSCGLRNVARVRVSERLHGKRDHEEHEAESD